MKSLKQLFQSKILWIGVLIFFIILIYGQNTQPVEKKTVSFSVCNTYNSQGMIVLNAFDSRQSSCLNAGCGILIDADSLITQGYCVNGADSVDSDNKPIVFIAKDISAARKLCFPGYKAVTSSNSYPILESLFLKQFQCISAEGDSSVSTCNSGEQPIANILDILWADNPFADDCKAKYYAVLGISFMIFVVIVGMI